MGHIYKLANEQDINFRLGLQKNDVMIIGNVNFGLYAFMPQGWFFMLFIILIESLIMSWFLTNSWIDFSVYKKVCVSNITSGVVGIVISMILGGGWWLVVWFPWVSENEVNIHNNQIYLFVIVYGLALLLTLIIELPLNIFLFKKYGAKKTLQSTLVANLTSYTLGTLLFYSYSFNLR